MATFRSHFPQLQGVMIMIMISSFEKHNNYNYNEAPPARCYVWCTAREGAGMIMLSYNSMYTYSITNECPRALLCLVYCAGRAQSCFLTILRIPSALLTRLAPASCTLHPEFYTP